MGYSLQPRRKTTRDQSEVNTLFGPVTDPAATESILKATKNENDQVTLKRFNMGLLTPNDIKSFRSLYTLQLRYLLSVENQIVKGLESMIRHANDTQLKQAFQSHMQ